LYTSFSFCIYLYVVYGLWDLNSSPLWVILSLMYSISLSFVCSLSGYSFPNFCFVILFGCLTQNMCTKFLFFMASLRLSSNCSFSRHRCFNPSVFSAAFTIPDFMYYRYLSPLIYYTFEGASSFLNMMLISQRSF